jgi:perosamine synthetase
MIPVNEPVIGERESEYVQECLSTGWISSAGRFIAAFEQAWAEYCQMKHGIAVSNGTVALELAMRALRLQPGDEVILPAMTIISCASAIAYNDAIPVLVDCDPHTWCMDAQRVEERVTGRTRAIMPVHIYGHPVDMDPVIQIAAEHGLAVIEDSAEAHGAQYLTGRADGGGRWVPCGSLGDISIFSFYANKLITTGEGGMLLTDDDETADRLRYLRNMCYQSDRRFYHEELGFNFRMTNLQAAVGLAQVERIAQIVQRKREIGKRYLEGLADIPGLQLPIEEPWARQVYWMFGVVLDEGIGLDGAGFAKLLAEKEIQTRPFFVGMHQQPALLERGFFDGAEMPIADRLARQGLYLPSGLALTDEQIDQVVEAVRDTLSATG